jgi:hypothetical protein
MRIILLSVKLLVKYKNIRIKKKGGGYRTQRVQVLASGKYKFVKNKKTSTKRTKAKKSSPTRRKKTVARRKSKKGRRAKRYTTISILGDIAPLGWGYMTISGNQIGEVLDRAIGAVMDGNEDLAEMLMSEIQQTLANVTANPVKIGIKLAFGVAGFKWISKMAGRRKIFQIGKFKLTT